MFERREQIIYVGRKLLRPHAIPHIERGMPALRQIERGGELAVAAVETENARSRLQPENVDKIVRRLLRKRDRASLGEVVVDAKTRSGEIGAGHGQPTYSETPFKDV